MANQLSKMVDLNLHKLSRTVSAAEEMIRRGTVMKDKTWEEVVNYFREVANTDRFIANDGMYFQYQRRKGGESLDTAKLKTLIFERLGPRKAKTAWAAIVEEQVSSTKLESAVMMGLIPHDLVDECITVKDDTFARIHKEWTKEDYNRAFIFDVQLDPTAGTKEDLQRRMQDILLSDV